MGVLSDIASGLELGREAYRNDIAEIEKYRDADQEARARAFGFSINERHFTSSEKDALRCHLSCSDNRDYMKWLLANGYAGSIKMIYIDPPFFTKASYNATLSVRDENGKSKSVHHLAYNDMFERNLEFYIANMTGRLLLMKDLLREDGLIWVHLDWHSSHYIRVVMDEIFGEKNHVNEIIWKYKSGGSGKRHFARKHDSILVYGKSGSYYLDVPKEKSYNRNLRPYNFKGVSEYKDEYGWYTLVNMKDVWTIDMVGRTSSERNGYATQKPLELMERIVRASTEEGDICADFFCGSGSLIEAASKLGRSWLGCDNEQLAVSIARKRLDVRVSDFVFMSNKDNLRLYERLKVEFHNADMLENGKLMVCCGITEFEPELDIGHVPMKERGMVTSAASGDQRSFIDYAMVDPAYDGSFSAEILFTDNFDDMRFITNGSVAFVAVDVFGREYFYRMDKIDG